MLRETEAKRAGLLRLLLGLTGAKPSETGKLWDKTCFETAQRLQKIWKTLSSTVDNTGGMGFKLEWIFQDQKLTEAYLPHSLFWGEGLLRKDSDFLECLTQGSFQYQKISMF